MTQKSASLKRQIVTPAQAEAIMEYGAVQTWITVELLRLNGVSELQATQALAMGFTIVNGGDTE